MAYGGFQSGAARLYIDENGEQQVAYDPVEVSPNNDHENVFKTWARTQGQVMDPRKSLLPYLLLYASGVGAPAAAGLQGAQGANAAAAGTGFGTTSGSSLGSVAGYSTPAATGLSSNAMSGASFMGAAAPTAAGTATTGAALAPTAFGVSGGATVGTPLAMGAGGTAAAVPGTIGSSPTMLPATTNAYTNPYAVSGPATPSAANAGPRSLPRTDIPGTAPHNTGLTTMEAGGRGLPANVTKDLATNYGRGYPYQTASRGSMLGNYGRSLAAQGAEAAPSLVASYFMGKDARQLTKEQIKAQRANAVSQEQVNAYREWMRPMVEQAMKSMIGRLPTHMQGNLPQNFPQLRYPTT